MTFLSGTIVGYLIGLIAAFALVLVMFQQKPRAPCKPAIPTERSETRNHPDAEGE